MRFQNPDPKTEPLSMGEAGHERGYAAVSVIKSNARATMSNRLGATLIDIHQRVSRAAAGT